MIGSILLPMFLTGLAIADNANERRVANFSTVCPTPEQMDPFIKMCGQNSYVAFQARHCADALVASWSQSAQRLVPMLQARGKSGKQHLSESDSQQNYFDAIVGIDQQIRQMQQYTALLEHYPKIMIDAPASSGDETSLSCFNEAFHKVQEIVSFLDNEIVRAKKIKRSATALMSLAESRQESLATSIGPGALSKGAPIPAPNGQSPRAASTITGEIHKELLNSRAAAKKFDRRMPMKGAALPFVARTGPSGEIDGILATFTNEGTLGEDGAFRPNPTPVNASVNSLDRSEGKDAASGNGKVPEREALKTGGSPLPPGPAGASSRSLASVPTERFAPIDVEACTAEETESSAAGVRKLRVSIQLRNRSGGVIPADSGGVVLGYRNAEGCEAAGVSFLPISAPLPPGGQLRSTGSLLIRMAEASKEAGYVIFVTTDPEAKKTCGKAQNTRRYQTCSTKWR